MGELILVRHPPVANKWQGKCYGSTDVALSKAGRALAHELIHELKTLEPEIIIHSDTVRTRAIALPLAKIAGIEAIAQPLWQERGFGEWERQSWQRIWHETGNAMDGMLTNPAGFRPGNTGETTGELVKRTWLALYKIAPDKRTLVVTHGGPIAAAKLLIERADYADLPKFIVPCASYIQITGNALESAIQTPCVRLCKTDNSGKICIGCSRTCEEIGLWGSMNKQARSHIMETLIARRAAVDPLFQMTS